MLAVIKNKELSPAIERRDRPTFEQAIGNRLPLLEAGSIPQNDFVTDHSDHFGRSLVSLFVLLQRRFKAVDDAGFRLVGDGLRVPDDRPGLLHGGRRPARVKELVIARCGSRFRILRLPLPSRRVVRLHQRRAGNRRRLLLAGAQRRHETREDPLPPAEDHPDRERHDPEPPHDLFRVLQEEPQQEAGPLHPLVFHLGTAESLAAQVCRVSGPKTSLPC